MKYAAIVLRNKENPTLSVRYQEVCDALLAGGVFLNEILLLPYDEPSALSAALSRTSAECEGIFVIADRVLLEYVEEALSSFTGLNPTGGAVVTDECTYFALPSGEEGANAVTASVIPLVDRRRGKRYSRAYVCCVAAPPEKVRMAMKAADEAAKGLLSLHVTAKYGVSRIEVIYDSQTPKMVADDVIRILLTSLQEYTYAMEDITVAKRLFELLKLRRLKFSTAESFTAGGVGQAIVEIPGASSVFFEGVNAYSNEAKIQRLGVNELTLKSKGAVSSEVAYEMAAGLIKGGNCDVAVSTTGIAGPSSDGSEKPVGLAYIAVGTKEQVRVYRYELAGTREEITKTAVNLALWRAYREIK